MKKIIGLVIASMMFANIGFAEVKLIEFDSTDDGKVRISTVCVDGYKFVVAKLWNIESISMVQFYIDTMDLMSTPHKSVPAKC